MFRLSSVFVLALLLVPGAAWSFEIGVGRQVITPEADMWMSGYASRSAPSDGKIHDLWAKALVFRDDTGAVSVILTSDLIGLTPELSAATAALVDDAYGIPRERLMLTASHTHCGPVLDGNLDTMYDLDEEQSRRVREYTAALPGLFFEAIRGAMDDLSPGSLHWSTGRTDFAKNRRGYSTGGVRLSYNPTGPVDHDVPVVEARNPDGSARAFLFGYACHNTTLDFQQICGDYAGFAQTWVEEKSPGATALFVSGCGADQNPLPRRSLYLARNYGESLGRAVLAASRAGTPVGGPVRAVFEEIPLQLTPAPARETLERQRQEGNVYERRRAARLLETLDSGDAIADIYSYPIQLFQFSDDLQITALGGEVVVDYSLRIKTEFDPARQFVIGYANDVMAYIPSLRVLREGGYEGEGAMVYYGLHGPWEPTVERDIMSAIHRMSGRRTLIDLGDAAAVEKRRPLRIAHRGGVVTESIPECSAAAILAASSQGYDLVELDVRESADHEPIVFHDRTLREATGAEGSVAERRAEELMELRYRTNGEQVMHLEEAVRLCARENLGIMLDIKAGTSDLFFDRIVGLIQRFELSGATMCINGSETTRAGLRGHVMLTVTDETEAAPEGRYTAFWFGLAADLGGERIAELRERGVLIVPAVNTFRYDEDTHETDAAADIARLLRLGVDGFQIDSVYGNHFD